MQLSDSINLTHKYFLDSRSFFITYNQIFQNMKINPVHIFWEGHKNLQIYLTLLSKFKKSLGDFVKYLWPSKSISTLNLRKNEKKKNFYMIY